MSINILDYIYNFLCVGPSGTGKTAFMCSYAESHYKRYSQPGFWITFPSIKGKLEALLPDYIVPTIDIFDPRFADPDPSGKFPRKFVLGDEFNRLLSKYGHSRKPAQIFVDLIALHRQKGFDFLASDQTFDFLAGVRRRAHWIVFSGVNDTVYQALSDNLSSNLMHWVDQNYFKLVDLGESNRKTIGDGKGRVVVTNGSKTIVVPFKRPEWYTLELSEIWKNVTVADLRKDQDLDESFDEYDFSSDSHKSLLLAYHIASKLFRNKLTKEKLSAAFIQASAAVMGSPSKLPASGRGYPELITATHSLNCFWCNNEKSYREIMENIIKNSNGSNKKRSKETIAKEKELIQHLQG